MNVFVRRRFQLFRAATRFLVFNMQPARHAEVNKQIQAVIKREIDLLAAPFCRDNAGVLGILNKLLYGGKSTPGQPRPGSFNFSTDNARLQLPPHGFCFW